MFVNIRGAKIFLKDHGTGPPTLFLHGNPDTADIWDSVTARLHQHYRCIVPDLPGFGRSRTPQEFDCSFGDLGKFVDELLESMNITQPINLVAHDFGGAFAMVWAAQHPEKVRRIVVMNTPCFVSDFRWHFWGRIWRIPIVGELSMIMNNWPLFYWSVRRGSRNLTKDHIRSTYSRITSEMKRMVLRLYRAANPESFRDWEPRMLQVTAHAPTLVLWGEDRYIPSWVAHRFGATEVKYFENCGHWVPAEAPNEVAAELLRFFIL